MHIRQLPWWLEEGPESCPFCDSRLHYEALLYCADCDRPVCPTCLVEHLESRSVLCPECHDERGGG